MKKLVSLFLALTMAFSFAVPAVAADPAPVAMNVRVEESSHYELPVEYIFSLVNAKKVMNATIRFEVDGNMLSGGDIEYLTAGFSAMEQEDKTIVWTQKEGNIWQGELLLMYLGDPDGFTSAIEADIFALAYTAKQLGNATLRVTEIRLVGLDEDGNADFLNCEAGEASTLIALPAPIYSIYDLNRDGVVDERDLAMAQRYYQVRTGDANWAAAQACDFDGDGVVDMLDLIELFKNFGTAVVDMPDPGAIAMDKLAAMELAAGESESMTIAAVASNGQSVHITASSDNTGVATVSVIGNTVTVHAAAEGTATIAVIASALNCVDVVRRFAVTVTAVEGDDAARVTFNFNSDWAFSKGVGMNNSDSTVSPKNQPVVVIPSTEKPYEIDYDVSGENWSSVSLPHTYNDEDTFDRLMESGHNGERNMYSGTAWYKKTFTIPSSYAGKRIFIEFEAARQAADVYINGVLLEGRSENGFIPFGYDITDYVTLGVENDITVMVDNIFPYLSYNEDCTESGCATACQGHVLSWHDSHWHPNHGGLYRNVYLHITDPLHVTLPLYSFLETQGVYVYTTNETETAAKVNVESEIINQYDTDKTFQYVAEVRDMEGNVVLTLAGAEQTLAAGAKASYTISGTLHNAKRWSDAYPYLYTVQVSILVDEAVVDTTATNLGIRTFRFTNDQGFFANGNYVKLQGWGQKSTNEWAGLGAAYPDWMQDYVIKLMKDAGGNFIRWGHTAGSPTQIGISDKYGLYVDQPGVDGEGSTVGGVYSNTAYAVRAAAFRDMIIYHRNSPSIVMWELGNQSMPGAEAAALHAIIQQYDHHGGAARDNSGKWDGTEESSERGISVRRGDSVMVPYVNVAITTEGSGGMGSSLGNKPGVEGEYNREEARRGVWDRYTPGFETYKTASGSSYNLTTEQFAVNQITEYAKIGAVAHNGGANWIFSDSTSHGRVFSEVTRASGEVDAVMLPKEAYYALQTVFTDEVDIHLIGHWNYPAGTVKPVYVASDADSVELFLNGVSLGKGTKSNNYLFTFANVAYAAGELKAVGYNKEGTAICESVKRTHGEPAALKMTPITGPQGLLANGSDILLLDVEVVDAAGNRCLTFDGTVNGKRTNFTINDENGSSIWRGGYNSGIEYSTNNKHLYIEAGITRVAVRTTMKAGEIVVTAATDGLTSDTVRVTSVAVDNTGGVSRTLNVTPRVDLSSAQYPGVGEGERSGSQSGGGGATYRSALVTELGYTGTGKAALATPAIAGKQVYSDDKNIKFGDLPIYLLNSDYLQAPGTDAQTTAVDLVVFMTLKKVNVYVAHADDVPRPSWLLTAPQGGAPFTDTGENVVIDGVTYSIFVSVAEAGTSYTVGSNVDNGVDGVDKRMYVMFFKEYGKDMDFYSDNFNSQTLDSVPLGWYAKEVLPGDFAGDETKIATTRIIEEADGNRVLKLYDNIAGSTTPNFTVLYSEFLPLSGKFSIEYKFYDYALTVGSTAQTNVAVFLTDGPPNPNEANDHTNTAVESYIMLGTRPAGRDSSSTYYYVLNANVLQKETWYTVKYLVDVPAAKYSMAIYDSNDVLIASRENIPFRQAKTSVNHLMIRSGGGSGTHMLFDDVKVELIDDKLSEICVDGTPIAGFSPDTLSYEYLLEPGSTEIPIVTATPRERYASVSVQQAAQAADGEATIKVAALHGGAETTYTVNFIVAQTQEVTGITLNGKPYLLFEKGTLAYEVVLPPTAIDGDIPVVAAVTNFGSAVIVQAADLTKTATVTVGEVTYTITFSKAGYELYEDFDGDLSQWIQQPGGGPISIVSDAEKGKALQLEDTNAVSGGSSPANMTRVHGTLAHVFDNESLKGKKIVLEYDVKTPGTQTFVRGLFSNSMDLTVSDGKRDLVAEVYLNLNATASNAEYGSVKYRSKNNTSNTALVPALGQNTIKFNQWNHVKLEVMTPDMLRAGSFTVTVNGTASGTSPNSDPTAVALNAMQDGSRPATQGDGDKTLITYIQFATGNGTQGTVYFANVRVYVCDDF